MSFYRILLIILAFSCFSTALTAQSVMAVGEWYKFSVSKEGVYKLTYNDLITAGISPGAINPHNIRIYGNEGGMLPQDNSASRPFDLQESAIKVVGGEDNKFDQQDYILFFAHGPDSHYYDEEQEIFKFSQNKYARKNFYFLNISEDAGKRITAQADLGSNFEEINTYADFYFLEEEDINLLSSGREWYGKMNSGGSKNFSLPFIDLAPEGTTKVYADVMAQTLKPSRYTISIGNHLIGSLSVESIVDYNNPDYKYYERGKEAEGVFTAANSLLGSGPLQLQLQFEIKSASVSRGYYNKVLVQTDRQLIYNNSPLLFRSPESKGLGLATFRIKNGSGSLHLWDVTDPYVPYNQDYASVSSDLVFGTIGGEVKKYVLFNPANIPSPAFVKKINNQDLKSISTPDLLIVAPEAFVNDAQRLADFRSSHDGYNVAVTGTEKIYNEFSSGRQDITAIRDYIKYLYDKSPGTLKYVLLVGKGSYDYLDYSANNTNVLPIYQSYNSLHPVYTYSSDDYYGFLEAGEGDWEENGSGNHTLDISIGRLPVVNNQELRNVIDKLIHYSSNTSTLGSWRTRMLFTADDEDGNLHHRQSDELAGYVSSNFNYFVTEKFFLGSFDQEMTVNGKRSSRAQKALKDKIQEGALLINYTGHGGHKQWTDEQILTDTIVDQLKNKNRLPLFVTATCDFGRHDDPLIRSGGERLVLNPEGGGIGIVTTSRPVYSYSNFSLNKAFFQAFKNNISTGTLGDIFKETKNNSLINVNNRNFSLLGDPSMKLAIPSHEVRMLGMNSTDTLKALQKVVLKGQIINGQGDFINDFNGIVDISVADKPVELSTKEEGSTSGFSYKADKSFIYRGKATVSNGYFESTFIIPQDIDHKLGNGRIKFYARENTGIRDAASASPVKVGGTAEEVETDGESPEIMAYLEDTTFRNGDLVGSNTILLAQLSDKSGINITARSFDGDIAAYLDGERYILNDHFYSDLDDFSTGWISFPLNDLSSGEHVLTLTASDSYNNTSEVELHFIVADDRRLIINELNNYPNPALTTTSFVFTHNRAGEPLEGELNIFNSRGEKVLDFNFETAAGQVRHKIVDWNCRGVDQSKLVEGIYYYRINIRSKTDGASAEKYQKLILIN